MKEKDLLLQIEKLVVVVLQQSEEIHQLKQVVKKQEELIE